MIMAQVPSLDTFQVTPNTLPGGRMEAHRFHDTASAQATETGEELNKVALEMEVEAAQAEVTDADAAFSQGLAEIKANYVSQQGKNAVEGFDPAAKQINELRQKSIGALKSPLARKEAARIFADRARSALDGMVSHNVKERQAWRLDGLRAHAGVSAQESAADPSNSETFGLSLNSGLNDVEEMGRMLGWGEETLAAELRKYNDHARELRYKAWTGENAAEALAHFQERRAEISDPLVRDRIGDDLLRNAEPQLTDIAGEYLASRGAASAADPARANEARGVRNNNPGNIERGGKQWEGEVDGDDPRFAVFDSPEAGIRAMGKNLLAYRNELGIDTVKGIVSRWAPAGENGRAATDAYIGKVAKEAGVAPDERIDVREAGTMDRKAGKRSSRSA
jgi:hypothetical protein